MKTFHLPFISAIKGYELASFRKDLVAGLTVAVIALPQSMAYAIIAGLNPVYGIYSAIVASIVGSLMGSSSHLITGPTNAISLLVASGMQRHLGSPCFLEVIFLLTLLVGAIQLLCGAMKLGRMVSFVSHSVVVGFTCGAGLIIAIGQLNSALGIQSSGAYEPIAVKLWKLLNSLDKVNLWVLAISASVIAAVLILKHLDKRMPGPLIALIASIAAAKYFGIGAYGVKLLGEVPSAMPHPALFHIGYEEIRDLIGVAVPIAVIGLVEAISIAKSLGGISGEKINANQEFIGQGFANAISSFFQCYPSSGSFTRSAINFYSGAVTRFAGVYSGLLLAGLLLFFAPFAQYIPKASLAAIVILIGIGMVNVAEMRKAMAASRSDGISMWITFGATILMPDLDWAIYMGILISIALYLRDSNSVPMRLLVPVANASGFQEREIGSLKERRDVVVIHIEGNLYFGLADDLARKLDALSGLAKVFIIRMKHVTAIDLTALEALDRFIRGSQQKGEKVLLCGVRDGLNSILGNTKMSERVGPENIFLSENAIFDSTKRAYERALGLAKGDCKAT